MKLSTTLLSTIAALGLSAVAAQAAPVTGSYALTVAQVSSDTVDLSMASNISFAPTGNQISTFTSFGLNPTTANCLSGACGTINNITGIPAGSATTPFAGVSPLFTTSSGISFSLTALTKVIRTTGAAGSSLELKGTGLYTAAGFTSSPGTFDITAQNGAVTIMADSASASGTATASAVPEPASLAVLGVSLAAVGFVRRRKNG